MTTLATIDLEMAAPNELTGVSDRSSFNIFVETRSLQMTRKLRQGPEGSLNVR
ncbi:MAG: hypothetical protein ACI8RZ_006221 [Myxococcota bacterium]|jgi:hypothetical protein